LVVRSADAAVIARKGVGVKDAAFQRVAFVVGAQVCIVAQQDLVVDARGVFTMIAGGALVAVVANNCVGRMDALAQRSALVVGTGVAVVAVHRAATDAFAVDALVAVGASVAVIAGTGDDDVLAADSRQATVFRARVLVVTLDTFRKHALAFFAVVSRSARIVIAAPTRIRAMHAPDARVARIIGAFVAVVALKRIRPRALSIKADIPGGAHVAIVADVQIVLVDAPGVGGATVTGARVAVVANRGNP